jgi:hypothetical protein
VRGKGETRERRGDAETRREKQKQQHQKKKKKKKKKKKQQDTKASTDSPRRAGYRDSGITGMKKRREGK